MSHTTVDSNKAYKTSVAGSDMYVTENSLEIPKETKKLNEGITTYIEEQGNLEIPVGDAVVTKNDELKLEDGTILMMHSGAFNVIMKHQQEKEEQQNAIAKKEKTSKVKAGKEER